MEQIRLPLRAHVRRRHFLRGLHAQCHVLHRASNDSRSAVLAKKKKVVRREWTKDDVKTLKTLAKQKAGVKRIAKALKRTPAATAVKAHTLGVSLDTRI